MITAPYNFVPLSKQVVCPDWAEHVSHDILFRDGKSGEIKLKITAESPIYVRNGLSKVESEETNAEYLEFNNLEKKYFIPGSSIKGMIRSVMEIMSFGRMANKVDNGHYSVRDFQNRDIYPKETFSKDVLCGWLYKDQADKYHLINCGRPGRIDQKDLSTDFHAFFNFSNLYNAANKPNGWNPNKSDQKSAAFKYKKFGHLLSNYSFDFDRDDCGRAIYKLGTDTTGQLVFTGQPGKNDCEDRIDRRTGETKKKCGKHYEFIFINPHNENANTVEVNDKIIENFKFAFFDHDVTNQKEDWKIRKEELENGDRIPVFFRFKDKEQTEILDLGLSYLYKITFEHSIHDLINKHQVSAVKYDLAETIFGYTESTKALKSRVSIGHAFSKNGTPEAETVKVVLAGPKASYYPTYIKQDLNKNETLKNKYSTYNDETAEINGWKRYPIREDSGVVPSPGTDKVSTNFVPLQKGAEFETSVRYHNLRKEELGALLSAIKFHNTKGPFHSLGMGKPLGYGKVSVTITGIDEKLELECMRLYEAYMEAKLNKINWHKSEQIKELFSMASGIRTEFIDKLNYMKMKPKNEFVAAKGPGENDPKYGLLPFSKINDRSIIPRTLINENDLIVAKAKILKEKGIFKAFESNERLKEIAAENAKFTLEKSLETKKAEIIEKLLSKKKELIAIENQKVKDTKSKAIKEKGIDFTTVDFHKNYKSIEDEISNIVKIYSVKIHGLNKDKLEKEIEVYLISVVDIEKTKTAIIALINKLPLSEKAENKMIPRYKKWQKWIGEMALTKLKAELK
jgi:CRISPR-associated protein (TIGR03986 family)